MIQDGCFYEYINTKVICLEVWETQKNIASTKDCQMICNRLGNVCKSGQYQTSKKECSLYQTGVEIGRHKRGIGCYGKLQPVLVKNSPDYTYFVLSNLSICNNGYIPVTTGPPVINDEPSRATEGEANKLVIRTTTMVVQTKLTDTPKPLNTTTAETATIPTTATEQQKSTVNITPTMAPTQHSSSFIFTTTSTVNKSPTTEGFDLIPTRPPEITS